LTQSGSARGGSSHEVERTKRERVPAGVDAATHLGFDLGLGGALEKIVTSTLPIATTPR